jgi:geranylgeranyl pyrophosphate synthase
MDEYKQKALDILLSFPKNENRDSLELMLTYVIERKN